jgi:hypothetical protein
MLGRFLFPFFVYVQRCFAIFYFGGGKFFFREETETASAEALFRSVFFFFSGPFSAPGGKPFQELQGVAGRGKGRSRDLQHFSPAVFQGEIGQNLQFHFHFLRTPAMA